MYSSFLKEPVNHIVVFHISVCGTNGDMLCVKCAAWCLHNGAAKMGQDVVELKSSMDMICTVMTGVLVVS